MTRTREAETGTPDDGAEAEGVEVPIAQLLLERATSEGVSLAGQRELLARGTRTGLQALDGEDL